MSKNTNLSFLTDYITADITNGRIGINNASPTVAFDVVGATKITGVLTLTSTISNGTFAYTLPSATGTLALTSALSGTTNYVAKFTSSTTIGNSLIFDNGTNVGIGTTSASSYLANKLVVLTSTTQNDGMTILCGNTTNTNYLFFARGSTGSDVSRGFIGYNHTSDSLVLGSNDTERMRITSGGSLLMAKDAAIGINTADGTDDGYLALCGASGDGPNRGGHIYLSGNERASDPGHVTLSAGNVIGIGSVITFRTAGVERMRLIGNGRLIIGQTTDGGYLLYVNGNAAGTSGFANVSDRRLKKDITPIESALNKVKQLNGVSFNWDKTLRPDLNVDDNNHLGLIAQDVEAILPQVVTTSYDEFGTKTIAYSDIVPVLIEAIKEQQVQIEELKTLLKQK